MKCTDFKAKTNVHGLLETNMFLEFLASVFSRFFAYHAAAHLNRHPVEQKNV